MQRDSPFSFPRIESATPTGLRAGCPRGCARPSRVEANDQNPCSRGRRATGGMSRETFPVVGSVSLSVRRTLGREGESRHCPAEVFATARCPSETRNGYKTLIPNEKPHGQKHGHCAGGGPSARRYRRNRGDDLRPRSVSRSAGGEGERVTSVTGDMKPSAHVLAVTAKRYAPMPKHQGVTISISPYRDRWCDNQS